MQGSNEKKDDDQGTGYLKYTINNNAWTSTWDDVMDIEVDMEDCRKTIFGTCAHKVKITKRNSVQHLDYTRGTKIAFLFTEYNMVHKMPVHFYTYIGSEEQCTL